MNKQSLLLKEVFSDLIPGFGLQHAQIYASLFSSDVKTSTQIIGESGIARSRAYMLLDDLIKWDFVGCTNTRPKSYFLKDPVEFLQEKIFEERKKLKQKIRQLGNLIEETSEGTEAFVIKIGNGKQTKLINTKTKTEINDYNKLVEVKKEIEELIKASPERKKEYMAYKYY